MDTPAIIPGTIADLSLTFVFGMKVYRAVNAVDSSTYGDSSIISAIAGPITTTSCSWWFSAVTHIDKPELITMTTGIRNNKAM